MNAQDRIALQLGHLIIEVEGLRDQLSKAHQMLKPTQEEKQGPEAEMAPVSPNALPR